MTNVTPSSVSGNNMGCCESCGITLTAPKRSSGSAELRSLERLGIEEMNFPPLDHSSFLDNRHSSMTQSMLSDSFKDWLEDERAHEVEMCVSEVLSLSDWKVHVDDLVCQVKSIMPPPDQKTDPKIPIFSLVVDFGVGVDFSTVLQALYDPHVRMQWDKGVALMEETSLSNNSWLSYSVTKMPFPFKDRDFSEKRVIKETAEAVIVVLYCLTPETGGRPTNDRYERAETLFSWAQIDKVDESTRLLLVSQCNLKLIVSQAQLVKQVASQMKTWTRLLKKEVLQLDDPA